MIARCVMKASEGARAAGALTVGDDGVAQPARTHMMKNKMKFPLRIARTTEPRRDSETRSSKRQRTAALQDAGAPHRTLDGPPGSGVRLSSAAFHTKTNRKRDR